MDAMRITRVLPALLASAVLLSACGGESPEKRAARHDVRRTLCVAEELSLQAKERLASLDTVLAGARGTPMESTVAAAYQFAFAMKAHADSAMRSAAYMDSSMTARADEDSARYAALAIRTRPPAARANTVEENAAVRYSREMAAALGNPAHPCNKTEEK